MSARLVVSLAAAALVGLLVADLGITVFLGKRLRDERGLAMRAALLDLVAAPAAERQALRSSIEQHYGVSLVESDDPAQLGITLGDGRRVVARLLRDTQLSDLAGLHSVIVSWLLLAGVMIVGLGLFFQRRVVSRPLARVTELVGRHDQQALVRLSSTSDDELARLSRAIIAMRQELDDDRVQIRHQLGELTQKNEALASAQAELVRAERLAVVGQLAAGVAHEIGNPLAVLAGFVDVLRDPSLPDADRKAALSRMGRELDRIQGTVRSLLDFSRAPTRTTEPGTVLHVVEHVRALLRPQDRMRRVQLELESPPADLATSLGGDALTQLLLNLLLNAADAMAGEGTVRLGCAADEAWVTIDVDDSGPGVPEAMRTRIFEPFFTTKPAGSGTGLGLSVCERIVTAAGGRLSVETSPLGGARFRVVLPRYGSSSASSSL